MILREEQMQTFREESERQYRQRVSAMLRRRYSKYLGDIEDDLLAERIDYGMQLGQRFGLRGRSSLATFVALLFVVGPTFHEQPTIRRLLRDRATPAHQRMGHAIDHAGADNWEEAKDDRGEDSWPRSLRREPV